MNSDILLLISNILFLGINVFGAIQYYNKGDFKYAVIDAFFVGCFLMLTLVNIKNLIK